MVEITRSRYAANFVSIAQQEGIAVNKILSGSNLNESLLENHEGFIAIPQFSNVIRNSVSLTGNLNIGWYAAEATKMENYGDFGHSVTHKDTLFEKLNYFCEAAQSEYSEADFCVGADDKNILFIRKKIAGDLLEGRQTELYVISMMIATVQDALGTSWAPDDISLQTFQIAGMNPPFCRNAAKIQFDQKETVIRIKFADVTDSISLFRNHSSFSSNREEDDRFISNLESLIQTQLSNPCLSLNMISKICDMQPRTFQRYLKKLDTSFVEMVSRQRFVASLDLLKNADTSIAEVSHVLGFANQAHFSHAFRKRAGLSPMAYRRKKWI